MATSTWIWAMQGKGAKGVDKRLREEESADEVTT